MYYLTKLSAAQHILMGNSDVTYEDDRKVTALNDLFFDVGSADNISNPVLQIISKYRNHLSKDGINNTATGKKFNFKKVVIDDVMTEIQNSNTRKLLTAMICL